MRLRFSRTGRRSARGFTLLELILTLAILGLAAGLVGVSIGRLSRTTETRSALTEIVNTLAAARIEAMRGGESRTVRVRFHEGRVLISGGRDVVAPSEMTREDAPEGREARALRARALRFVDEHGREQEGREARFGALGRTRERVWLVADGAGAEAPAGRKVRIWRIEFDPISGAPVLRWPGTDSASEQEAR